MNKRKPAAPRRTRKDPRKAATRAAIIEAAESLFAEYGIDGVSLRQIGAAAGSSNTGVVAYHFGSKRALVDEILHYRLPGIDARRGELLQQARQAGRGGDVLPLVRAMWLPLFEQVNAQGRHSYAGFLAALIRSNSARSRQAVSEHYAASNHLADLIDAALPPPARQRFVERLNLSALMITGVLQLIDQSAPAGAAAAGPSPQAVETFQDALRMTAAALLAPAGD